MKIYDKHSYKLMFIVFGTQILLGVSGLIRNHTDFFSYVIILLAILGIGGLFYFKKYPYVEVDQGEVIKHGLVRRKIKLSEIKSIDRIDNTLVISSEDSKIKIKRDMLDVLEIRAFESFIRNEISSREI